MQGASRRTSRKQTLRTHFERGRTQRYLARCLCLGGNKSVYPHVEPGSSWFQRPVNPEWIIRHAAPRRVLWKAGSNMSAVSSGRSAGNHISLADVQNPSRKNVEEGNCGKKNKIKRKKGQCRIKKTTELSVLVLSRWISRTALNHEHITFNSPRPPPLEPSFVCLWRRAPDPWLTASSTTANQPGISPAVCHNHSNHASSLLV